MPRLGQSARARRRLLPRRPPRRRGRGRRAGRHPDPEPPAAEPEADRQRRACTARFRAAAEHVSPADRRAIDRTLDRFVPAGVARKSPATAWALAGPELKSGSTLAAWKAGNSPIPYYPVLEKTFHTWRTIDVGPRYVVFNLLVHAQPTSHLGSYVFSGEVVKQGDQWLVNRIYTIAIMNPVTKKTHEVGPADFVAPPPSSPDAERQVDDRGRDHSGDLDPVSDPAHPALVRRDRAAASAPLAAHGAGERANRASAPAVGLRPRREVNLKATWPGANFPLVPWS